MLRGIVNKANKDNINIKTGFPAFIFSRFILFPLSLDEFSSDETAFDSPLEPLYEVAITIPSSSSPSSSPVVSVSSESSESSSESDSSASSASSEELSESSSLSSASSEELSESSSLSSLSSDVAAPKAVDMDLGIFELGSIVSPPYASYPQYKYGTIFISPFSYRKSQSSSSS